MDQLERINSILDRAVEAAEVALFNDIKALNFERDEVLKTRKRIDLLAQMDGLQLLKLRLITIITGEGKNGGTSG